MKDRISWAQEFWQKRILKIQSVIFCGNLPRYDLFLTTERQCAIKKTGDIQANGGYDFEYKDDC